MMPNSVEPQIPRTKQSEELGGEEKHMAMNDPLLVCVGSSTFTFVKGLKKKTLYTCTCPFFLTNNLNGPPNKMLGLN